jgi:hypothetical protein
MNTNTPLCSNCFSDAGLKIDANRLGIDNTNSCSNCNSITGKKLTTELIETLAYNFFVKGTINKTKYGAAPIIQANFEATTDIEVSPSLTKDVKLFENTANIRFFYYGPRMWMIGEVEPLKALHIKSERERILNDVFEKYPSRYISETDTFYRLRRNPKDPSKNNEYDSSPFPGKGRLDSKELHIMYGSQDLQVCVHECRVTVEDELYLATLRPKKKLQLLNLTELIEEDITEFESLDIAIQMLFLAGKHSYRTCRAVAQICRNKGYDGIIYPSYFSSYRTGAVPFETIRGISIRKFPSHKEYAKSQTIQNFALFGKPIENGEVEVECINKLILNKIDYGIHFGPAKF